MNAKALLVLLVLSLVTILVLVCMLLVRKEEFSRCGADSEASLKRQHNDQSLVFADLSAEEMVLVRKYLQSNLNAPLVDAYYADPSQNCIYYMEVKIPPKEEVLKFLDHKGRQPPRQALVVVYFGNQPVPNVTEYVVGPLPRPAYHRDVTVNQYGRVLFYHERPVLGNEYEQMHNVTMEKFLEAPTFLMEVFGHNGSNFAGLTSAPRGFQSGDRETWVALFQNVKGYFLHPVGMEFLLDHSSLNVSRWSIPKVFYNGVYYDSFADLERNFKKKNVRVTKVKAVMPDGAFSSMQPRVTPLGSGPLHYEPCGKRYSVKNNQVLSMLWSFAYRMDANRGPHIYDIRFRKQRIVYELSVQEALSVYGSNSPGGLLTRYMDGSFGIGRYSYSLVKGVDCPYSATYLDATYFFDNWEPEVLKNSICVFEQNVEVPFRRHFSNLQSLYYGGLPATALVLRSVATLGNYDYIWDFIFHPNGAIESKVRATGYITSAFLYGDGLEYGNRVGDHTLGTIHTHFINYKVDLDVGGVKNSLISNDMTFENIKAPWSPDNEIRQMKMVKNVLDTEDKAAFRLHDNMPRYVYFAANSNNKWGHKRGYRIQLISFAGDHLPETDPMERSVSWSRYKLAVTKRKENEPFSTSIYNQNDPWTPSVAFADFINNESLIEEDLVAWITTGFLHIPHAEDVPNTVTLGNAVGFLLRPYNYFDEDPSIHSPDGVFFTSEQDFTSCDVNHIACLPKTATCVPKLQPFTFEGFQNLTRL
ncbi:membrane primary amine oxidase isoform X1 [Anolis carolinensis]|uniref:Amine oxidase n=1 Tax=Anolis carolinensis TaxID=28377 RepID=G1KP27_ANOCA|nr:PREDICTED: membrane primary amine oxidase isoform X1 [Anolis carolinensis]|eukprot:XP_003222540.1 PREDICTED: membrane primary amine oxidase isoform X1 [Anolis carolinensis]